MSEELRRGAVEQEVKDMIADGVDPDVANEIGTFHSHGIEVDMDATEETPALTLSMEEYKWEKL